MSKVSVTEHTREGWGERKRARGVEPKKPGPKRRRRARNITADDIIRGGKSASLLLKCSPVRVRRDGL